MRLLRSEITKLLFQKRTYVGWLGLVAIPTLMMIAIRFGHPGDGGGHDPMEVFVLSARHNGLILPVAAIAFPLMTGFVLPLLSAMAGGYQLGGETESGTIKTWLVHPVDRGSVLMSKWAAAVVYVLTGLALVAASSYIIGVAVFGAHPLTLLSGGTVSIAHGLGLTLMIYVYVAVAMITMISLAMLVAVISDSSLTATVGTLVFFIVLNLLGVFSLFDFLKPYLFTSHWDAWQGFFQQHIDWWPIEKGLLSFLAYIVASTVASWILFRRKDVLA